MKMVALLLVLILAGCGGGTVAYGERDHGEDSYVTVKQTEPTFSVEQTEPKLSVFHLSHSQFNHTVANPRPYQVNGLIKAGVVPHHAVASVMMSGFFNAASQHDYDTVIIIGPNHFGDMADIVLSDRDWDIGGGLSANKGFVTHMMEIQGVNAAVSHSRMEEDHAASVLIPFVYHYLSGVKAAPVLLNRSLSLGGTAAVFERINEWVTESGENVLLVASIDFSHFLTMPEAMEKDRVTMDAVMNRDYHLIHSLTDNYIDSPASMIVFLMYLESLGLGPQIIDNANAADFLGYGLDETTSYMVIVGASDF